MSLPLISYNFLDEIFHSLNKEKDGKNAQYQKMLNELESGKLSEIERKILDVLLKAPNALTCQGLIRIVFGVESQRKLGNNDPHERKIRKGIESLLTG